MASNLAVLTQSHTVVAAKKRAKREQIKEIIFDDNARREFLTGFHKRKLAKAEAARKKAAEREKQQRQEVRREQRRMLRERAAENAAQVESAYGAIIGPYINENEEEEWHGIAELSDKQKGKQKEQEYEDERHLATVAVVEDFDPDTLIHGPPKPAPSVPSELPPTTVPRTKPLSKSKVKSKVRYQTKGARRVEQTKQHARRREKAELAGGKAARRGKGSKGNRR
ncbi:nucleolar protein 12-domain-containing protein [Desarmillaria tabescens]|uniref:Nucleolar protein 12-domain-containing protein n=1 Tax=Armillaria tabescens TaxID=1929756 RepID=A0AA39N8W0_ARMTA|nr:nucleolar protein 12-domain-containing protein [Desarmillaria tabescens]KAK0461191.1 nucleolar protein 12-domain-containing protein [Desarmillaria tabescens]